jgi:hypothetical protein
VSAGRHSLTALSGGLLGTAETEVLKPCQVQSMDMQVRPLREGELLVILKWTRHQNVPDDLDMHFSGPGVHVFYDAQGDDAAPPYAKLLVDNIKQPDDPATETIHISPMLAAGAFTLEICDFKGESKDGISQSQATVEVFGGGKLLFNATAPPGGDRDWKVFTLDRQSGKFERVDRYSNGTDLAGCLKR